MVVTIKQISVCSGGNHFCIDVEVNGIIITLTDGRENIIRNEFPSNTKILDRIHADIKESKIDLGRSQDLRTLQGKTYDI